MYVCVIPRCAGVDTVGQVRAGRRQDTAVLHRRGHVTGDALCAGPVPVRAATLDAGQVDLPAARQEEERQRRQHEREPQQFHANNVRSILAAAALIRQRRRPSFGTARRTRVWHDRVVIIRTLLV